MKLINPYFKIQEQPAGLEGIYKQIEYAGRVCYKSEDKITKDSAKPFVDRLLKSKHLAMLEHGTVYLKYPWNGKVCGSCNQTLPNKVLDKYCTNKYSVVKYKGNVVYITTNYRVIIENHWEEDLKYLCNPTEFHEKRITVHFVCDRGVSHEFVRHRVFSFAQESTRYCNYSKDKFGDEITFIKPCWLDIPEGQYIYWDGDWCDVNKMKIQLPEMEHKDIDAFLWTLNDVELQYRFLLNCGWKPQEARAILPNALKTELIMTGFVSDWQHFFDLRSNTALTGKPHPQAEELATPLRGEFVKRGLLE